MKNPFLEESPEPPEAAPPKDQKDEDWMDPKPKLPSEPKPLETEPS
jgi:hypothetical protein